MIVLKDVTLSLGACFFVYHAVKKEMRQDRERDQHDTDKVSQSVGHDHQEAANGEKRRFPDLVLMNEEALQRRGKRRASDQRGGKDLKHLEKLCLVSRADQKQRGIQSEDIRNDKRGDGKLRCVDTRAKRIGVRDRRAGVCRERNGGAQTLILILKFVWVPVLLFAEKKRL